MRPLILSCLVAATAFACGSEAEPGPPAEPPTISFEVTASGRVFNGNGAFEGLTIVVPAGAVADAQTITVVQREGDPLPAGGLAVGPQFEIGPADLALAEPLDVTLPFDPSAVVNAGGEVRGVKVWAVLSEGWTLLDAEVTDTDRVRLDLDTPTLLGAGIDLGE